MPLKELAKRLGISRQAVNHRMKVLTKLGAFKTIKAEISFHYYDDLVFPRIWGISKAASVDDTLNRLGESEFTVSVDVLGGKELAVFGCLRSISELDGYVEFVKQVAEITEPTIGLVNFDDGINPDWCDGRKRKQSHKDISPLDLKIIALLHSDARKPIAEIADSVGVSIRTVRRHLECMRSEGPLDYYIPLDFPPGEDMFTLLYINLRSRADKAKVGRRLLSRYPLRVILVRSFSNIPDFLVGSLSSDKMSEIRRILREIGEDEDVLAVTPNLVYLERTYDTTWDYKLLRILASSSEKARKQSLNSGLETR